MISLDSITLSGEFIWTDEFQHSAIRSTMKNTIQGKVIITESEIKEGKGRSITLSSDNSWMSRLDLTTLYSWAQTANKTMLLTLHDARTFNVKFRAWDLPVIDVTPVWQNAYPEDDMEYITILKLVTV
jgi:hypothetical protein